MAKFTTESNHAMWDARWEEMFLQGREDQLGPKGQAYITEKYGEDVEISEPPFDEYEDHSEYDFDVEY